MKKLRLVLVAALASSFMFVGAAPASANCTGEPVDACAAICQVGQSNKYTAELFEFCWIW